ncbi:class I SAM-dependent DNA methyltransferase [Streptomyces sp. YIM B13508]|uniref:HsdM family class I SAM-dependent methyltransferase n=1 Tax=Streptomyces sp. YIM B13508 TaxID=3366315 RepID=UPI0036A47D20
MVAGLTLVCPIRGRLKAKGRSADGLQPSEERLRVDAIRHLISLGYPKENFVVEAVIKRFGNSGRNSFRADLAVLDVPASTINKSDVDELLEHAILLGEIKRDNASASDAKNFQVKPLLDFASRDDCVALYWDNIEQRVFWVNRRSGRKVLHEGPLTDLPQYGQSLGSRPLTFATIDPDKPLLDVFKRIEDVLHAASIGPSKRFSIMMQLLLVKLYDEHSHEAQPNEPLDIQDYAALDVSAAQAAASVQAVLKKAVQYYQKFLPEPVSDKLSFGGETLLAVMKVLAPIKIVAMRQNVIQDFYMYFAKHVYKWDLAQYFTPPSVTDFIIEVLNPRFSEHVKDPACGSADFLTSAFRRGQHWPDYASSIWGSDVSPEAVQVAVLNMILNGDGKTNIAEEDSLAKITSNLESCDVVVCNPPFGTRIVERNPSTLDNFDLGHEWVTRKDGSLKVGENLLTSQETGLLFAEACCKLLRPGGRFALVVPNGYLGNRSQKYEIFREWLLRNCRVSVIIGLPRFSFKGSGADVSASVIFCEKRDEPLKDARDSEEYELCVEVVDRVGWNLGDKRAAPIYRRDEKDGTFLVDEEGKYMLDSDFEEILARVRASDAVQDFNWLVAGVPSETEGDTPGWTVPISEVIGEKFKTLDPKRLCRKMGTLRAEIKSMPHFRLGDVVKFMPEGFTSSGDKLDIQAEKTYRHVEITDVAIGSYRWQLRRGWELPARAKHPAEPGDIYIGSIWSSVRKWFLASQDCDGDMIVTNGLHRMRLREGMEDYLLDLVVGLCSEAYATQMRGFARGSDGLAEIPAADVAEIVLPKITDDSVRREVEPFVQQLIAGFTTIEAKAHSIFADESLRLPIPPPRPDHTSIV